MHWRAEIYIGKLRRRREYLKPPSYREPAVAEIRQRRMREHGSGAAYRNRKIKVTTGPPVTAEGHRWMSDKVLEVPERIEVVPRV